jgi:glyoxylase-like metal-dependent hydrolase (beta-lactamase superfamily II)
MITIKEFVFNSFATNTYILSDNTNECIIIDPGCTNQNEETALTEYIENNELKPVAILNTHFHVDHIAGIYFTKNKYNIDVYGNNNDNYLVDAAIDSGKVYGMDIKEAPKMDKFLNDGDIFKFGNSELKVILVPGHSKGSLAYYSEENNFVISGDVLFNGSIGRTDLAGGDLDVLLKSIKEKLFTLDQNTVVYSGHGPETTIGNEINSNPFLLDNVM